MDTDPFAVFSEWFDQAAKNEPSDHDAVAVASVGSNGQPTIRMVLMREFDVRGFVFYTNLESRKGHEFRQEPSAAMCFHWKSTARQVRIDGRIEQVSPEEADRYFASRPRESQVGAWASIQSATLVDRQDLEQRVREIEQRFSDQSVPRPDFWSGYRLIPEQFEFWDKRPHRLHDRTRYDRDGEHWQITKLYP